MAVYAVFLKACIMHDTNDIVNGDNAQANSWVVCCNPFLTCPLFCLVVAWKICYLFLKDPQ
jgi:hypothetical protein